MTDKNLSNLWIVNYDGSNMMPITTGNHNSGSPKWSNSGKMFTFKSNKNLIRSNTSKKKFKLFISKF